MIQRGCISETPFCLSLFLSSCAIHSLFALSSLFFHFHTLYTSSFRHLNYLFLLSRLRYNITFSVSLFPAFRSCIWTSLSYFIRLPSFLNVNTSVHRTKLSRNISLCLSIFPTRHFSLSLPKFLQY